jgi:hypothetical protein
MPADNNFLEKFAALKNQHGHTSIDHFLVGVKQANKQNLSKLKSSHGEEACDKCAGDGVVLELVHQYSRLMVPVCSFNRFVACHGCLGTGLDLEFIRNRKKAVAA